MNRRKFLRTSTALAIESGVPHSASAFASRTNKILGRDVLPMNRNCGHDGFDRDLNGKKLGEYRGGYTTHADFGLPRPPLLSRRGGHLRTPKRGWEPGKGQGA